MIHRMRLGTILKNILKGLGENRTGSGIQLGKIWSLVALTKDL